MNEEVGKVESVSITGDAGGGGGGGGERKRTENHSSQT